jgi:glucosamine--fructose-6-phosphate aminotransferase (isomerizing)
VSFHWRFSIVYSGMIENDESIKKFLSKQGFKFYSETDPEVLVNLMEYHFQKEPGSENKFLSSAKKHGYM